MSLVNPIPYIESGNWNSVVEFSNKTRQAIQQLAHLRLGVDSSPIFAGLTLSDSTIGSVLFAGTDGIISQDNTNLFWDNTNKRLGIGTNTPSSVLDISGDGIQLTLTDTSSTNIVTFEVDDSGDLTVNPNANKIYITSGRLYINVANAAVPPLVLTTTGGGEVDFYVSDTGDLTIVPAGGDVNVTGNITASVDVTADGDVYGTDLIADDYVYTDEIRQEGGNDTGNFINLADAGIFKFSHTATIDDGDCSINMYAGSSAAATVLVLPDNATYLRVLPGAPYHCYLFDASTNDENKILRIYGYPDGLSKKYGQLQIVNIGGEEVFQITAENGYIDFGNEILSTTGALNCSGGGSLTGTWSDLGTVSTVDINGGTIDGITSLTVANNVDIGNYTLTANGLTIDGTFTDGTTSISGGEILDLATIEATTQLNLEIGDVAQINLTDGKLAPTIDNDIDLGDVTHEYKDLFIDGIANIDSLVADTADINGGTIDAVTIGTNSACTELVVDNININGNTIQSTSGDLTLDVPTGKTVNIPSSSDDDARFAIGDIDVADEFDYAQFYIISEKFAAIYAISYNNANFPFFSARRARGTIASPANVVADDILFRFGGGGYSLEDDEFPDSNEVTIEFRAGQTYEEDEHGTYISFSTVPNGSKTISEKMRVYGDKVGIGGTTNYTQFSTGGNITQLGTANAILNIDGGTVDGITSLTVANNVDIGNFTLTANGLTIDGTFTDGTATIAGGVITGSEITIDGSLIASPNDHAQLFLSRPAERFGLIWFQTAGVDRWRFGVDNTAEGGSNAGSDFQILRRADNGTSLGPAIKIIRSNGNISLGAAAGINAGSFSMIQGAVASDPTFSVTQVTNDVTLNQTVGDMTLSADGDIIISATDLTFAGTARIGWAKITAGAVDVTGFTEVGQTDAWLQSHDDGTVFTATEVAGGNNDVTVNFTSVTAFNWVQVLLRYQGSASHHICIQLEVSPFNGTTWETFGLLRDQPADECNENMSFFIAKDPTTYINSGVVKVRLLHTVTTVNNHLLVIDEVALYQ